MAMFGRINECDIGAPLEISPSHLSQPSSPGIPDGGPTAWLQFLCGFFLFSNSWGVISSYGVFQVYYTSALFPDASASTVSWIGSVEAFMLCCTTIFAGPLVDRGYGRLLVFIGTFLVVSGLMTLSMCEEFWQLMLAQGLCMGIGHGCLFITSIVIVPTYFSTKRSLAIGIAASGSSVGGVVYSIIFNQLMDTHHLTFEWTTRVLGITALATLLLPCLLVRQRRTGTKAKKCKIIDLSSFRQLPFTLFNLATFVGNIGLYIPFFYIATFGTSRQVLVASCHSTCCQSFPRALWWEESFQHSLLIVLGHSTFSLFARSSPDFWASAGRHLHQTRR
ncbi:uncharacterized protein RHO25_002585 [Cercospora beticola]|uniref:Transporter MCH4 n=1 Tax=Cercospora beticola TaxID=122368 RepID=A0ABZ0NEN8_CERBT|nr:hypothetical protein RHO25_002585 [Cercospora beticola]